MKIPHNSHGNNYLCVVRVKNTLTKMGAKSITFSNEDYLNFELIGINSREKDFRLAWFLNKDMRWSLERMKPYILETKEQNSEHELFKFVSEENHFTIHLISNRSLQGALIPEYAQIEYLLKCKSFLS